MTSVLLCSVHPHSCAPLVHTGYNIYLHSFSLLCIGRAYLLPMSQYIYCILVESLHVFFLTCTVQRSLASSVKPRHFAVFQWGMALPFICWHLVLVKSKSTYLASFNLTNHFLVQLFTLSTARCKFSVAFSMLYPTAMTSVSSAKVATVAFSSSLSLGLQRWSADCFI